MTTDLSFSRAGAAEIDLRTKVDAQTDAVLDAVSAASGRSKSEIAREWLFKAAENYLDETILAAKALAHKGLFGDKVGSSGA